MLAVIGWLFSGGVGVVCAANWVGEGERVQQWGGFGVADRVRISFIEEGLYRVTAAELAVATGWDEAEVVTAIATTNLALSCGGKEVAWLEHEGAMVFYGERNKSIYAPESVYWVTPGVGRAMVWQHNPMPEPFVPQESFPAQHEEQGLVLVSRYAFSTVTNAPFATFDVVKGGPYRSSTHSVELVDVAPGLWQGSVRVAVMSDYNATMPYYEAVAEVGGAEVGRVSWYGEGYHDVTFPYWSTNLNGSTATLRLSDGLPVNMQPLKIRAFYCNNFTFEYQRLYRAVDDMLRCSGTAVTVSGFSCEDVVCVDVSDPLLTQSVGGLSYNYDPQAEEWSVSFVGTISGLYYVCAPHNGTLSAAVRGVSDVDWAASGVAPQYAIIVPPEAWRDDFRAAVAPLAAFRATRGLRTAVIDVEDIYNRYSYGVVDPHAIRDYCAAAYRHGLRYVLLVGGGSLDFKHLKLTTTSTPAALIPTFIAGQVFELDNSGMTVALDAAMADIDGDGLPDIALGRLPTSNVDEVAVVVAKTIAYEAGRHWRRPYVLIGDWEQHGSEKYYAFHNSVSRLLSWLAVAGRESVPLYRYTDEENNTFREDLLEPTMQAGAGLLHFIGHTNDQGIGGGKRILVNSQITANGWTSPVVAVVMGCRVNRWQSPTVSAAFLQYGLFKEVSGFVAALGPTGNMAANDGDELALALYSSLRLHGGSWRLGDMLLAGLREYAGDKPAVAARLQDFSLIGDPALRIGEPARGTVLAVW